MAALLALLGSGTARAAEWSATPTARLGIEYADNPVLAPKSSSSYVSSTGDGTAEMSADIAKHGDGYDLTADPHLLFARYLRHSLFDHDNQYLTLAGDVKSERTTWQATAAGTRDTALTSEVGVTGITDTNRRHENLNLSAGPSWQATERLTLAGTAGWLANHYVDAGNTGLVDYRYSSGDANAIYQLTERTQAGIDLNVGQLTASAGTPRSTDYAAQATLTSRLTELWTANLSGGPVRVDFSGAQKEHANGAVYAAGLQHQGELFTLNAKASRSVTPTGRGVLTRYDQFLLSCAGAITERLSTTLTAQYSRNRDYLSGGAPGNYNVRYYSVQNDLQWQLSPSWSLLLTTQAQRQRTTVPPNAGENASSYRINFGVVWTGRPRRL